MRTGTKKCILLLLAIIVLCFAVWLLWPHSFAEVTGIPAEYPDLNMAAIVTAARFENGSPSFDIWNLQYCSAYRRSADLRRQKLNGRPGAWMRRVFCYTSPLSADYMGVS